MATLHKSGRFTIRVNGNEHPPVHAHVLHTDGRAIVYLNGRVVNSGIPDAVLIEAKRWIDEHQQTVIDEWSRWN